MEEKRINLEWDDIVIERADEKPITIKKGKITIGLPENIINLANTFLANRFQTTTGINDFQTPQESLEIEGINCQNKNFVVPTGFTLVNSGKENVIMAYNEKFGYLTYIPEVNGGGVWTNSFEISKDEKTGFVVSKPGQVPLTGISIDDAHALIKKTLNKRILSNNFIARICTTREYDAILKVITRLDDLSTEVFSKNSSEVGLYLTSDVMIKTGVNSEYTIHGINNLCGNTCTLTACIHDNGMERPIAMGGHYGENGEKYPASFRRAMQLRAGIKPNSKDLSKEREEYIEHDEKGEFTYYGNVYYGNACARIIVQPTIQNIL